VTLLRQKTLKKGISNGERNIEENKMRKMVYITTGVKCYPNMDMLKK